jgi:hypothetical protein
MPGQKMDTGVAELVTFFQALKGGSLFLLALVLIGLPLTVVGVAYQVIVIKRFQAASKATQENFETIAADLRTRALEVKKHDEGLRKRDLEVKERDELKGFVKDANAELTEEPQRPQQPQVLKGSQRALKESVSQIITVGLKDIQNRMLQTDSKGMTSVVFDSSRKPLCLDNWPELSGLRWRHMRAPETPPFLGPTPGGLEIDD